MNLAKQLRRTTNIFTRMWAYLRLAGHPEADCRRLKKRFARELYSHLGLKMNLKGPQTFDGPAIYVCNHISYVDIPVVMGVVPDASFVSKSEVAYYPVIGMAARRIETVFVKRESRSSRRGTRQSLAQALSVEKKKIIVFPSATTTIYKTDRWRKGVFEIAHELGIPIIPIRLGYLPLREVAYIDDDTLLAHIFRLVALPDLKVTLEFGSPIYVKNPLQDCESIKEWCEAHMDFPPLADAVSEQESPAAN